MRRAAPIFLALGCALVLVLACFRAVLFGGGQLAFRDAGHFYYPLYRVVQAEWSAGRWPLWNPWQNAGTPLLGWPMAAVLYPGKLLYAVFPYPVAASSYLILHLALALAGAYVLSRSLGTSGTGSWLAALGYAFGAPVLSQYANVIYLVGAAWMPWGLAAVGLMARGRASWGLAGLAVVLAMQVVGGDPEAAYLTGLAGALYAVMLPEGGARGEGRGARKAGILLAWCLIVLAADLAATRGWLPEWETTGRIFSQTMTIVLGLLVLVRPAGRGACARRMAALGVVCGSIALAAMLAAVQIVPAWEYARRTTRQAGPLAAGLQDFSVEPYRLAELAWPHVYGLEVPENRSWLQAMPPAGERMVWSPSLYLGAFVLVLAVGGASVRSGTTDRRWLTILLLIGLAGAMGKFAGPLWWARWLPGSAGLLGPHDPPAGVSRGDAFLPDGAGSIYGLLATFLPGFAMFRYPAKLSVLAALATSCLAGMGWDRLRQGDEGSARFRWLTALGLVASLWLAVTVVAGRSALEGWIGRAVPIGSLYGPVDARGAVAATLRGLLHGGAVCAIGLGLIVLAPRRAGLAGAGVLILVTADLAIAGVRIVGTVPRSDLEGTPEIARLIARAEESDPAEGPFRIHRVEQWHPSAFAETRSPHRLSQVVAWEHDTLDRLHAEPYGLACTIVRGVLDVEDYVEFFEARAERGRDERGVVRTIYSFPRGGYDLWGARYLIMPVGLNGWMGPERGYTRIAPGDEIVGDSREARRWDEAKGWQLLRNPRAFPRCWVVHSAIVIPPIASGSPERAELVATLVDSAGGVRLDPRRMDVDLRRTAFVEAERSMVTKELAALKVSPPAGANGTATIVRYEPQRVEIRADLKRPGLVVLADALDPGWVLTIDGGSALVWRTNRMMRGATVPAGRHTLVYEYHPGEMRRSVMATLAGIGVLGVLIVAGMRGARRVDARPPGSDPGGRSPV